MEGGNIALVSLEGNDSFLEWLDTENGSLGSDQELREDSGDCSEHFEVFI